LNNSIKLIFIQKPRNSTLRGFLFRTKEKMDIDYTKLNDRIVKQAWNASTAFLTEAQKQRLFQNKIDRAAVMLKARAEFERLARED